MRAQIKSRSRSGTKKAQKRRRNTRKFRGGFTSTVGAAHTAVIVEPRQWKSMEFVLANVLENLDLSWNVVVFHGNKNKEWLEEIIRTKLPPNAQNRISLSPLGVDNLSIDDYNKLMMSKDFLNKIPTEMFLVFQTDSMICPQNKDLLQKFMKYDYVGAPWPHEPGDPVGNGGFSLRRKSKMLEIVEKCPPRAINEDLFFANSCPAVPISKPTPKEAEEFSIEGIMAPKSFGIHKIHRSAADSLEAQCTGAKRLRNLNVG